jgi:Ca2+-binding EF-hand superfamily protein
MKQLIIPSLALACSLIAGSALSHDNGENCSGHGEQGKAHAEGKRGAMFQRMDKNGDQKISKAEALELAQAQFEKMDGNKNLVVTKEEMRATWASHHAGSQHKERHVARFKEQDKNQNGKLELAETHMDQQRFGAIDKNGDGGLTMDELSTARKQRQADKQKTHGQPLFDRLDHNKDGQITQAENETGSTLFFSAMDTNQDGFVTQEEAHAAFQKHHERSPSHPKKGERGAKNGG